MNVINKQIYFLPGIPTICCFGFSGWISSSEESSSDISGGGVGARSEYEGLGLHG